MAEHDYLVEEEVPGAESDFDVAGSEDVERPLVGCRVVQPLSEAPRWQAWVPRVAAVTGLALAAWAGVAAVARGSGHFAEVGSAASARDSVELRGKASCRDAPSWTNGFYSCMTNGYTGPGCEARGLTCEAYEANGWCKKGAPVAHFKDWAFGERMNFPELNCCACGGGSGPFIRSQTAETATHAQKNLAAIAAPSDASPGRPAPAACAAYSACAEAGLAGNCCPNVDDVRLECCDSAPVKGKVCEDTPFWSNGYVNCQKLGFTDDDGCTSGGVTCAGYVKQGFCDGTGVVKGKEWTLGGSYNHPELHCCACGKLASGSERNAVWST